MASLFFLPKVVSLPGSKLYFYRTGTATAQDVFTDEDLTTAHSQPVTGPNKLAIPATQQRERRKAG